MDAPKSRGSLDKFEFDVMNGIHVDGIDLNHFAEGVLTRTKIRQNENVACANARQKLDHGAARKHDHRGSFFLEWLGVLRGFHDHGGDL